MFFRKEYNVGEKEELEVLQRIYDEAIADGIWVLEIGCEAGYLAAAGSIKELEEIEKRTGQEIDVSKLSLGQIVNISASGNGATREEACRNAIAEWKKHAAEMAARPPFRPAFGALPPPQFAWTLGKTVATIKFVNAAERFIEAGAPPDVAARLRAYIERLKTGQESLTEDLTVEEYLKKN